MNFHIITLFPQMFDSYINESILAKAKNSKLISFNFYNPRDFVRPTKSQKNKDKPYLRVDDKPYGGGPGMVMQAEPVAKAIDKARSKIKNRKVQVIHLSPSGRIFDNSQAKKLAEKFTDVIIVCGRYEGIDARVKKIHKGVEYSVGNFILTGGELPGMIIIDSVSRQIKGVLGDFGSLEESRIAGKEVYTRPEVLEWGKRGKKVKFKVPKVLISGNHKLIDEWRKGKTKKGGLST